MSPEQISRLLDLLEQISSRGQTYTITGAADWPILVIICGILVFLIGAMWNDQRASRKEDKADLLLAIANVKKDNKSDIDNIWKGMRDCKNDCCHPSRTSD